MPIFASFFRVSIYQNPSGNQSQRFDPMIHHRMADDHQFLLICVDVVTI
jgi:hypothetical protein